MPTEKSNRSLKVSVVIPVRKINDYIREAVDHCNRLDYKNYEIIILPDTISDEEIDGVRLIATGEMGPAEKRNIGIKEADGSIIAFLDDDSYPVCSWLTWAVEHFEDPTVGAVGGPAVTPDHDSPEQKTSGFVFSSYLGGGSVRYRYVPGKTREVDDYASVNLLVRRDLLLQVGMFNPSFYPGEDTILCLDIVNAGKKILYDPNVLVFHHRRKVFGPHLKQVANYAKHRGFFVKKFPQTSFRFTYFIPSLFALFLPAGFPLYAASQEVFSLYVLALGAYICASAVEGIRASIDGKHLIYIAMVPISIFLTHLTYGIFFLWGLCLTDLKD